MCERPDIEVFKTTINEAGGCNGCGSDIDLDTGKYKDPSSRIHVLRIGNKQHSQVMRLCDSCFKALHEVIDRHKPLAGMK